MYCDLNVPVLDNNPQQLTLLGYELVKLGYQCIGLNYIVDLKTPSKVKNADHIQELDLSKYSTAIPVQTHILRSHNHKGPDRLKQLKRLTLIMDNMQAIHSLSASNKILNSYDLVAVIPTSTRVFEHLCQHAEIDIIGLDICHRLPFALKKSLIDEAVKRGITFEVSYSGALSDSTARRHFISNLTNLVRLTKGKNIILTSAAKRFILLRSPFDLTNLLLMANFTYGTAKDTISRTCTAVIKHGETRKTQGCAIVVDEDPSA